MENLILRRFENLVEYPIEYGQSKFCSSYPKKFVKIENLDVPIQFKEPDIEIIEDGKDTKLFISVKFFDKKSLYGIVYFERFESKKWLGFYKVLSIGKKAVVLERVNLNGDGKNEMEKC